jgi:DNA-binding response OmpR family regulator
VIAVISSSSREAAALTGLTSSICTPVCPCTNVRQFETLLRKAPPALVLTRLNMTDGYSDDIFSLLTKSRLLPGTAVIVLAGADCTPRQEARQLDLGADCVLRDPLRPEVLIQYVAKLLRSARRPAASTPFERRFTFADATVSPDEHNARLRNKSVHLSPKEIELARLLTESAGQMITYEVLYSELFGRAFSGDTANLRVLLGKLVASFQQLRINLRASIEVIPKSGCRYSTTATKRAR